jgi:uncharacterized protein
MCRPNEELVIPGMAEDKLTDEESGRTSISMTAILERLDGLERRIAEIRVPGHAPIGNPSPLGLIGFAVVSWLSGVIKIFGRPAATSDGLLAGTAIFIGGIAQLIAGLIQYPKNNTHSATVFCLFGFHWISQGFIFTLRSEHYFPAGFTAEAGAAYYILLTVMTVILWIPTFRMNHVLNLTLFVVIWVYVIDAVAAFGFRSCQIIAGVLSCMAATLAFYMCALDLVNESFGRVVFPIFPHKLHKKDYELALQYIPKVHYHKSAMSGVHV